jgi:hypothetical protein
MMEPIEVTLVIHFPVGSETPDREELEEAIQTRYADTYIVEYEEEEV